MLVLGGALIPVGGVIVARFFILRRPVDVPGLYGAGWTAADAMAGSRLPGSVAWAGGSVAYLLAAPVGGALPALAVSIGLYLVVEAVTGPEERRSDLPAGS